jgi:hypothetical protein
MYRLTDGAPEARRSEDGSGIDVCERVRLLVEIKKLDDAGHLSYRIAHQILEANEPAAARVGFVDKRQQAPNRPCPGSNSVVISPTEASVAGLDSVGGVPDEDQKLRVWKQGRSAVDALKRRRTQD